MKGAADSDWLGTPGAARYLGVSQRTVYKLIDAGQFPAYRLGRVIRLRRSDIDSFLERVQLQPGDLGHLYPPDARERPG